jgi:transcriptional regulator with XRE-family HTH domain
VAADESVWDDLGFALYRRRLEIGIKSQRELERRSGVNHNTISLLERGKSWSRRGTSWAKLEAALELEDGWISRFVAQHPARNRRALTAETVERAVLDSIAEHAPQLTVRQARLIAAATARRLEQGGLLGRPGG